MLTKRLKRLSKDLFVYLFFVIVASGVWFFHALSSVRNVTLPVAVQYEGIPDNIGFEEPLPTTIEVKIRDIGERLRQYHQNPPVLEFDLSSQLTRDHGKVHLNQEVIRRSLTDQLRGTSHVQEITPAEFQTTYYKEQERVVPIELDATFSPASQYQYSSEPSLSDTKIRVFGKKPLLDKIKSIRTEAREYTNLKDSTTIAIALICPEGVRLEKDAIQMTAVLEKFTEKTIRLTIHESGVPDGWSLHLFPAEATITFRVPMAHFNEIANEDIELICEYPQETKTSLPIQVRHNNPYIGNIRINPTEVEYLIEEQTIND